MLLVHQHFPTMKYQQDMVVQFMLLLDHHQMQIQQVLLLQTVNLIQTMLQVIVVQYFCIIDVLQVYCQVHLQVIMQD